MSSAGFVGREAEIKAIAAALTNAADGCGSAWFLCGEPGIGKSRLAEEVGLIAASSGMSVHWGRCWEAGGAPAYWPWIQLLRGVLRTLDSALTRQLIAPRQAALLVSLVPELADRFDELPDLPPVAPEQDRFLLLDAVARLLADAADHTPLLLVLEDLHAADTSSRLLLDFVARQARSERFVLLGTFRDAEVAEPPPEEVSLLRIAQEGHALALRRLGAPEVETFLQRTLKAENSAALTAAVYDTTEGNPLFVVEVARLLVSGGIALRSDHKIVLPPSLRTVIRRRLDRIAADVREVLELGSVLGRELNLALLSRTFERDPSVLRDALQQATAAALLVPQGEDVYRFSHILIREVLYQQIDLPQRRALHLRVAETLVREARGQWSEIGHHYVAAGAAGIQGACRALGRAAEEAITRRAFDEAIASYNTALDALCAHAVDVNDSLLDEQRFELLLGRGRALLAAGKLELGQQSCSAAADVARQASRADRLARAALTYGELFLFAAVDAKLVCLLEEALEALGETEAELRARAMARLAAALQPAADPRRPIELAKQAIELARCSDDDQTLLASLRAGCSTMMDLADAAERLPFNREQVAIARRLGDRPEALRGNTRLAIDLFELDDLPAARAAIAEVDRLATEIDHPFYCWRARAFEATDALWTGRLDEAARAMEQARDLGVEGGDPNATMTYLLQRARLLTLQGRYDALCQLAPQLRHLFGGTAASISETIARAYLIEAGRPEEALDGAWREAVEVTLQLGDRTALLNLARVVLAAGDRQLASQLAETMLGRGPRLVSGGVIGMTWDGPQSWTAALLARASGRIDEAAEWFESAITRAEQLGGRPARCCIIADFAAMAVEEPSAARLRDRVSKLCDEAATEAERLGMHGLSTKLTEHASLPSADPAPDNGRSITGEVPAVGTFSLIEEGDFWTVSCQRKTFRLRRIKGLTLLSQLLAHPRREFHVLDLLSPDRIQRGAGRGDAGELLDDEARAAYRQRVMELREELQQAEALNDRGRSERLQAELQFIEQELARAVGLGGRQRRAGSDAERARVNVQRRLKDAIRRISAQNEVLGQHLSLHVRTGTFCSYAGD